MTFGERIRELRTQKSLTQPQLADSIGVSVRTVKSYELKQKPAVGVYEPDASVQIDSRMGKYLGMRDTKHTSYENVPAVILPREFEGMGGYPLAYCIHEGNKYEGHTMLPTINEFVSKYGLEKFVVVAGSGKRVFFAKLQS